MSQTLLYPICLQTSDPSVSQFRIIQQVCGASDESGAPAYGLYQGGVIGYMYRYRLCRLNPVEGVQASAHSNS